MHSRPWLLLAAAIVVALPAVSTGNGGPVNDSCGASTSIGALPFTDTLDTTNATSDPADPDVCGASSPGTHSVWYSHTPTVTGTLYAATLGSDYDTVLAAYTGTCAVPSAAACNDALDAGPTSYVSLAVQAGVPVLLEIAGAPGAAPGRDAGLLRLSVDLVPDKAAAKAVGGCQKALLKGGASFELAAMKNIGKCTGALFKCLQTEGPVSDCFLKACDLCHVALPTACRDCHSDGKGKKDPFAKLAGGNSAGCVAVPFSQMQKTTGIGYELRSDCSEPVSVADIGYCTASQHDCEAARLIATALPRAREMIAPCNVPPELECLPDYGIGNLLGDDPATAKRVVACQAAIVKATNALVTATTKSLQACVSAAFGCVATKNADAKCLDGNELVTGKTGGADATCNKQYAKILAARAKLAPAIDKACGAIPFDTLKSADAANLGALGPACQALGVPALATLADYEECLARRQHCVAKELLRREMPRADSVLEIIHPTPAIDDAFCKA